jgi:two-component system chemotaxis response regulator CheY
VVVLDLNMPDIGGYEVIEFIRGQDKLLNLPILVVTTRGDESSRARALAAGATRFMTKPFAPEALLGEVRALIGARPGATA